MLMPRRIRHRKVQRGRMTGMSKGGNELAFGADYAETLRRWREVFLREEVAVKRVGFDTRFMRIWEFYLAYCEAAFDMGNTNVVQYTLRKPAAGQAG